MKILLPKREIRSEEWPSGKTLRFFLGGPIRGGGDWQHQMCLTLQALNDDCLICCPCRWDETHRLAKYFLLGKEAGYTHQLAWERDQLNWIGAGTDSCIIFWLPVQCEPRPSEQGPYARDTYGELGEWRGRMMKKPYPSVRMVVGGEPGFPGLDVITRNFRHAVSGDFPVYPTMEETAEAAVKRAKRAY